MRKWRLEVWFHSRRCDLWLMKFILMLFLTFEVIHFILSRNCNGKLDVFITKTWTFFLLNWSSFNSNKPSNKSLAIITISLKDKSKTSTLSILGRFSLKLLSPRNYSRCKLSSLETFRRLESVIKLFSDSNYNSFL